MIGKIPKKFEEKLQKLPFCSFDETKSKNYYDCMISSIIFEDSLVNDKENRTYKIENKIIGRLEEGNIQETVLPLSLFEDFKQYFVDQKNCSLEGYDINCSNQKNVLNNVTVSFIINNYTFKLNNRSTWNNNGRLFFTFNDDDKILLMSSFLGNYHRIYDVDNKKVYFSEVEKNISKNNEDNLKTLYIIIIVAGAILLIIFVTVIVIIIITKRKVDDLHNKINSISFAGQDKEKVEKEKEEEQDKLI